MRDFNNIIQCAIGSAIYWAKVIEDAAICAVMPEVKDGSAIREG